MERFLECRQAASERIKIADHMITMTYPLVNDTRMLIAVIENIFLALTNAMNSVLYYERLFKLIPPFNDTFESRLDVFRSRIVPKHNISREYLQLIQEIKTIIVEHKKSPVEFTRKDMFVIASEEFKLKTVSVQQIKEYIAKTKKFIQEMAVLSSKNEQIFR